MAYPAMVIPIMIASPGDVLEERDIVRAGIHDWNDVNSVASKVVLTAVGWDSHSSPDLSGRPQALINERVLRTCDLLVGIFWTRIGSPTGKSASGSVEEIEEHLKAGKPAMIYFSSRPVAPGSFDPEQYAQVKEFKEWCSSRGLFETFENADDFRRKFSKHLQITLQSNPYIAGLRPPIEAQYVATASKAPSLSLTSAAQELLLSAAQANSGTIMSLRYIGGAVIQAGKEFGGNARDFAKWEAALKELVRHELVVERGYKGQVFELTDSGWSLAEELAKK